jgi:hypothetical protein
MELVEHRLLRNGLQYLVLRPTGAVPDVSL